MACRPRHKARTDPRQTSGIGETQRALHFGGPSSLQQRHSLDLSRSAREPHGVRAQMVAGGQAQPVPVAGDGGLTERVPSLNRRQ
jgi:hypothetical protein